MCTTDRWNVWRWVPWTLLKSANTRQKPAASASFLHQLSRAFSIFWSCPSPYILHTCHTLQLCYEGPSRRTPKMKGHQVVDWISETRLDHESSGGISGLIYREIKNWGGGRNFRRWDRMKRNEMLGVCLWGNILHLTLSAHLPSRLAQGRQPCPLLTTAQKQRRHWRWTEALEP